LSEEEEALQNEIKEKSKLIVRIVPAFIDIAIFLSQLVILGSFFYVAYIWDNLNRDTECIADINTD